MIIYKLICIIYLIFAVGVSANSNQDESETTTQFKKLLLQLTQPDGLNLLQYSKDISASCRLDAHTYLTDLNQLKLWAVKMFDATGKFPSGFLNGNVHISGDLDLCHSISEVHSVTNGLIRGKFCQANIFAEPSTQHGKIDDIMNLVHSYRMLNSDYEDDIHLSPTFSEISWTFCLPSSCTHKDLEIFLNELIKPYNHTSGLEIKIKVNSDSCITQTSMNLLNPKSIVGLSVIICGLILSIVGGLYDYVFNNEYCNIKEQKLFVQILYAFSMRRNWKLLTNLSETENDKDDITCVHGIRFIFSVIIYLLHRSIFGLYKPMINRTDLVRLFEGAPSMIFRVFWNLVDTFVILSGLLTGYYATKKLKQGKQLNIKTMYIKRYLKFAPIFLLIISIMPFLSETCVSASKLRVGNPFIKRCETKFWKNLFLISNIDEMNDMCYSSAHQLITDFQLYLTSPFIILILWKYSQYTYRILFGIIVVLSTFKATTVYFNGLTTILYFGISLKQLNNSGGVYINPLHRAIPYLCGLALGYHMRTWKKTYLSYDHRIIGWSISIICAYYSFFALSETSLRDYKYNHIQQTIFAVSQPLMWSFTIGWIIYACHSGYGGILNKFLSMKVFQLFSRISYAFYMSQMLVIFYGIASVSTPVNVGFKDVIDLNEIVIILCVSILSTIVFIFPVLHLYSIIRDLRK